MVWTGAVCSRQHMQLLLYSLLQPPSHKWQEQVKRLFSRCMEWPPVNRPDSHAHSFFIQKRRPTIPLLALGQLHCFSTWLQRVFKVGEPTISCNKITTGEEFRSYYVFFSPWVLFLYTQWSARFRVTGIVTNALYAIFITEGITEGCMACILPIIRCHCTHI